jgi:signal-transduction protein with cAMP-binding, CBS, and nucleotidyltransferase domain
MEVEYYLKGDCFVAHNTVDSRVCLILDGRANIENESGQMLAKLGIGDYIGEFYLVDQIDPIFEYFVKCSTICQVGIISADHMQMLFEAFPDWEEYFKSTVADRLELLKEDSHSEDTGLKHSTTNDMIRRATTTIFGKEVQLEKKLNVDLEKKYVWVDIVHLVLLVFSFFALTM